MGFLTAREIAGLASTLAGVANARLTKIEDVAAMDPQGRHTGAGPTLWAGSAAGYLERDAAVAMIGSPTSRNSAFVAGIATVDNTDTFTILDAAGAPLLERPGTDWAGTTVTIEDDRATPATVWTFRVQAMRHDAYGTLDSVTLDLEHPARVS